MIDALSPRSSISPQRSMLLPLRTAELFVGELVAGYVVLRDRMRTPVRQRRRAVTASVHRFGMSKPICAKSGGLCRCVS
jgi:hypothetical protein